MILKGIIHAESPIYRGNSRKSLFTRDDDGTHRLVSLAGEISGTAQSLMDAFIGESKNGKNKGLLNQLWSRLYGSMLPSNFISKVECKLQKKSYPKGNFFDLRMGMRLDEDRWASEANANYKMETLLKKSVFDIIMSINDSVLKKEDNESKLYYLLKELEYGRFWFGAGKSRGLGRLRLEMDLPLKYDKTPKLRSGASHLQIDIKFDSSNPVLVGWNWGKLDPNTASFVSVEGKLLLGAMKNLPLPIRDRLSMALGGPILSPEDWKKKFGEFLPKAIAIWLKEKSLCEKEVLKLSSSAISKLGKGKFALSDKIIGQLKDIADKEFFSGKDAEEAINQLLGKKANMADRIVKSMEKKLAVSGNLDSESWSLIVKNIGINEKIGPELAKNIKDEAEMTKILASACKDITYQLNLHIDQHINLIRSDAWIDVEIQNREEHLKIKNLLLGKKIIEYDWGDKNAVPKGIDANVWREFVESHRNVKYNHMLNVPNLKKSITNDKNFIEFLKFYRSRVRQELSQPNLIDFRAGGIGNREISREYGKPYDNVFMRMLTWAPSNQEDGTWEIYIPGSTLKGAFRKRASQILKTLWGESDKTKNVLSYLFGEQGKRAAALFSDAYLADPDNDKSSWCSMDGVKMDAKTGQPIESAKRDYLFAYGDKLVFNIRIDMQDLEEKDLEAFSIFMHLIKDFRNGDIPLGGGKTNGFGWVEAKISKVKWIADSNNKLSEKLFGLNTIDQEGIWKILEIKENAAGIALDKALTFKIEQKQKSNTPPLARAGFISHKSFGGHCGTFNVEAEVLSPINIKESGEPSYTKVLNNEHINGWDFFAIAPPETSERGDNKLYALPSRSIRGMIRHIYSITSNSFDETKNLSKLNYADSLFGWIGTEPNQAIMGRISFSFGLFENPKLAWFKVPYPYGDLQFKNGKWFEEKGAKAEKIVINKRWRIFQHTPIAPIIKQVDEFSPDDIGASYFKAILNGSKATFTVRFWNLTEEEIQRLYWSLTLEKGLGHKIGNHKYLGFGSLKLSVLDDSFTIDWSKKYGALSEKDWQIPIQPKKLVNQKIISNYSDLKRYMNVENI